LLSLLRLASRAFINHEVRIPPANAPNAAPPNRSAFIKGSRGGFVDLRSGIGSGSVGKEGGRIGLSMSFTDISASSRMRPYSYKSCDECAVRQRAEPRLLVRKSRPRRGDFDGQKRVCLCESIDRRCGDFDGQESVDLWESLDRCVVGTLIGRTLIGRGVYGFFKAALL
jgi:hypothetical protein